MGYIRTKVIPLHETMKHLAIINHRDSFIYNLIQILREDCGAKCTVYNYSEICNIDPANYDAVILSPGPGTTDDYPQTTELLKKIALLPYPTPILGICLGLQLLGVLYGYKLFQLPQPVHGAAHNIIWKRSLPVWDVHKGKTMQVGLYHSWALHQLPREETLPVVADAYDPTNGAVMALHHISLPFYGLQFHPESILTPLGRVLIQRWMHSLLS